MPDTLNVHSPSASALLTGGSVSAHRANNSVAKDGQGKTSVTDTSKCDVSVPLVLPAKLKQMPPKERFDIIKATEIQYEDSNYLLLNETEGTESSIAVNGERPYAEKKSDDYIANSSVIAVMTVIFCLVCANFNKFLRILRSYTEEIRSNRSRANVFDEHTVNERSITFLLVVQFIICCGLLVYASVSPEGIKLTDSRLSVLGGIIALTAGYYGFQLVAYGCVGYAFSDTEMAAKWLRVFTASQSMAGVAMLLPTLLAVFYPACLKIIIPVVVVIYLLARIFFILKGFRIFYHNFYSLLYFILYLCTLEIIPPVLLYKCSEFVCQQA